jgi:hypothetical protein
MWISCALVGPPWPFHGLEFLAHLVSEFIEKVRRALLHSAGSQNPQLYFTVSPSAVTVRVRLFGAGMPLYFDFSVLSFQVPMLGLSTPSIKAGTPRQSTTTAKIIDTRFIVSLL